MNNSTQSADALKLVSNLQSRFVAGLEHAALDSGSSVSFEKSEWLRDEGTHGGGNRLSAADGKIFNRASVNVSQIHYDDLPEKKLGSATAISTIIHPANPNAPSVHIHISWTEMRDGSGYWRIMGDLNPSVVHKEFSGQFQDCMSSAAADLYEEGSTQGDHYFYIPALGRHRGVTHFYLESYSSGDPEADLDLATKFGESVIDRYIEILSSALKSYPEISEADRSTQLAYHTLYLFQVLTLDRGTTSGLLVHKQNDLGIMGSLPSHVDRNLLATWAEDVDPQQADLVQSLVNALPEGGRVEVTEEVKLGLAESVRDYYRKNPEALSLQASGGIIPPTVENHL